MLPRLNGPDGQSADVLAMYEALKPLCSRIWMCPWTRWSCRAAATGAPGWTPAHCIELGRGNADEVGARAAAFSEDIDADHDPLRPAPWPPVESADLRHDNGYAIRMRGVSTQVAANATKK